MAFVSFAKWKRKDIIDKQELTPAESQSWTYNWNILSLLDSKEPHNNQHRQKIPHKVNDASITGTIYPSNWQNGVLKRREVIDNLWKTLNHNNSKLEILTDEQVSANVPSFNQTLFRTLENNWLQQIVVGKSIKWKNKVF